MTLYDYILNETFTAVTSFGTPVFYLFAILLLIIAKAPFALSLFLSLLFVELLCAAIKIAYRKERPVPQLKKIIFDKIDANSFPSVHSARIALLVTMVILYYKNTLLSVLGIALMLGVGYSRIYLKRHYFIDVLFGFIIGIAVAIIAIHI